jgi:hypothetical protein
MLEAACAAFFVCAKPARGNANKDAHRTTAGKIFVADKDFVRDVVEHVGKELSRTHFSRD